MRNGQSPGTPASRDTRFVLPFLIGGGVFVVALIVRLLVLWQAADVGFMTQPLSDARIYAERAVGIASGDWVGPESFVHAPLYAYLLAGVAWAADAGDGGNYEWLRAARVVQIVVGSLACALMVPMVLAWLPTIERRVRVGVAGLAAFGLAVYPAGIFYDLLIQKTTVDLLLSIIILWLLGRAWCGSLALPGGAVRGEGDATVPARSAASRLRTWVVLGVLIGLFTLNRQNALALGALLVAMPVAQVWMRTRGAASVLDRGVRTLRGAALAVAVGLLALVLTLLPWAARNRAVLGDWVVSTPNLGQNLLMGNRADATGTYLPTVRGRGTAEYEQEVWVRQAERALGRELSAREVSDYYRDEAIGWIRDHPGDWLALTARKSIMLIGAFEAPDTEDLYHYRLYSSVLDVGDRLWHFGVLLPLAVLGLMLTGRHWATLWPLYAWLAITGATVVAFVVFGRYRFPMIPVLMLFAALGVVRAIGLVRAGDVRGLILAGLGGLAAGFVANWPIHHPRGPQVFSFVNHAAVLADLGRFEEARAEAERAIDLEPSNPDGYAIRGSIALDQNRLDEAERDFGNATRLDPRFPGAWTGLGNTRLMMGRLLPALEAYERSLGLWPDDPTTLAQFGAALAQIGEVDQAGAAIDRALRLDPGNPFALNNLGSLLMLMGESDGAVEALRRAIDAAPGRIEPRLALIAAQFNAGNGDAALGIARETWRAFPSDRRAQQALVEVLLRMNRFDEALAALEEIQAGDGSAEWAGEAERELRRALEGRR